MMELVLKPKEILTKSFRMSKMVKRSNSKNIEGRQMRSLRRVLLAKIRGLIEDHVGGQVSDAPFSSFVFPFSSFAFSFLFMVFLSLHVSQVIIGGQMGFGKTKLLETTIEEAAQYRDNINFTQANPLEIQKPLSVFRDMFLRMLDQCIHRNYTDYTGTLQENRCKVIISILKQKTAVFGTFGLAELAPVLNSVLFLELPENRFTKAMSESERVETASQLLIAMLQVISEAHPIVMIIDDAINLDPVSWKMLLAVARNVEGVLLILATRPINKSYMAAYTKAVPPEFKLLLDMPTTVYAPLRPRSDATLYKIACCALGVVDLPPMLADFILEKANGNPKIVKEFIYDLKQEHKVFMVEDSCVKLNKHVDWDDLSLDLRCPFSVRALIARRLDRLTYKVVHISLF
jgi:hypothetical protein